MLIDAHSHVDRYDLVGDRAFESAIAEIAQHISAEKADVAQLQG